MKICALDVHRHYGVWVKVVRTVMYHIIIVMNAVKKQSICMRLTVKNYVTFAMERGLNFVNRHLDRVYFRVERDGKWQNICFSDLTYEERNKVCENHSKGWYKSLAYHLADVLKEIGDDLDLMGGVVDCD